MHMNSAFASAGRGARSAINVTPLIDVVLVLLVAFMVLVPRLLMQTAVDVLPPRDEYVGCGPSDPLVLQITEDGGIWLNDEAVLLDDLPGQLRAALKSRSRKVLFLYPDDDANYGYVRKVMDLCRGAGVTTIGITTAG